MEKKAPLSANKRNLVVGVLMLVALFIFLDPLQFITPKQGPAKRDFSGAELKTQSGRFAGDALPALSATLALFGDHRVVFVGGHLLVKEHLDFFAELVKGLGATKTRMVGTEFLLASDQADIDRLVQADAWDEALARQLMFQWQALCGYQENLAVLKAAWQFNKDRPAGSPPVRLLGLNVFQDLSVITKNEDFAKPEIMKKVFAQGVPDAFMASRVLELVKDPAGGGSMLVIGGMSSAVSHWPDDNFKLEMAKRGFPGQKRAAALVSEGLGEPAVATVLLAGPWAYHESKLGIAWPVDGLLDQLVDAVPAGRLPLGLPLASAAIGLTECRLNDLVSKALPASAGSGKAVVPRLKDVADVLVTFGPVSELHAVTPIPGFITDANLAAVVKALPASSPGSITVGQLNESIRKVGADMQAQLETFRY